MLEIRNYFGDWKEATKEEVERFYNHFHEHSTNIPYTKKNKYFNENHIRGGHIMLNGKVETTEEQKARIFNHYKNDLLKLADMPNINRTLRFIGIEYVCNVPKINPFVMGANLLKEGITIVYDDTTISKRENQKKEKKVKAELLNI